MSKYTTGEIAKLCGVSVRTVQYYDSRNILIPSELSEGGRRLYSEQDLKRMKIICFLRDAGISINSIGELLSEDNPGSVISVLLEQQEQLLQEEVRERKAKLEMIDGIRRELKSMENFSVESIGDIAYAMGNKKKMSASCHFVNFGYSYRHNSVDINYYVDSYRNMVAYHCLGFISDSVWNLGIQLLFQASCVYLSTVP